MTVFFGRFVVHGQLTILTGEVWNVFGEVRPPGRLLKGLMTHSVFPISTGRIGVDGDKC